MAAVRNQDDVAINSIVGAGTFIRGHVELNGLMRIDGDFSGSVRTTGRVIVGQGGRADCSIEAGTVVVGGLLRGEVTATDKVVLLSSAVVLATIRTPRLVAEGGVLFDGRLIVRADAALHESGEATERRKRLLMETVARRESSGPREQPEATRDEESGDPQPIGAAQGGTSRWSE